MAVADGSPFVSTTGGGSGGSSGFSSSSSPVGTQVVLR